MNTNDKMRTLLFLTSFLLLSCSKNDAVTEPGTTEIPVSVFVSGIAASKAAPPDGGADGGADIDGVSYVDEVRIVTFRRAKSSADAFTYDQSNDRVLTCRDERGVRAAHGKVKSEAGYEYRTLAFGYTVYREGEYAGEDEMFDFGTLTDGVTTLDDFKLNISHNPESADGETFERVETPELFYGYCHTGDGQRIFTGGSDIRLTGVLFRCMGLASVTITGIPADQGIEGLWLFAETVHSQSAASDYSDFEITQIPVAPGTWKLMDKFVFQAGQYTAVELKAFVLAVDTRMKIRVKAGAAHTDYLLKYESVGDDSDATGVITPAADGEMLYIRRNKQYRVSGDYSILTLNAL